MAEWVKKQDPSRGCLQEVHLRSKETHRLEVRRWKRHAIQVEKKTEAKINISNILKIMPINILKIKMYMKQSG